MDEHSVRHADWDALTRNELYEIVRLRNRVFALEQRVTAEDLDGRDRDPETEHWWVPADDSPAGRRGTAEHAVDGTPGTTGTARSYLRLVRPAVDEVQPVGVAPAVWVIGRVATEVASRGRGLARGLVDAVLDAHRGEPFLLHAQEYVTGLYAASGFERFGDPYVEAGIVHVGMYRPGT